MDSIPMVLLFAGTILVVYLAIELGYRAGNTHAKELKKDKEKISSTSSTAILGLLGFLLVFVFGIVYSRYDSKKELVREEANLIRTAWLRADFLPEADRRETEMMLKKYTDLRLDMALLNEPDLIPQKLNESTAIQHKIWDQAVVNARKDMNSDVAALYIESLNEMINLQALRVAVGLQTRIPAVLWLLLYLFILLGMFSVGYQTSITESSRKSWLTPIMVLTFSLMITLIATLDRPNNIMPVSQQPLIELRAWMDETSKMQ